MSAPSGSCLPLSKLCHVDASFTSSIFTLLSPGRENGLMVERFAGSAGSDGSAGPDSVLTCRVADFSLYDTVGWFLILA